MLGEAVVAVRRVDKRLVEAAANIDDFVNVRDGVVAVEDDLGELSARLGADGGDDDNVLLRSKGVLGQHHHDRRKPRGSHEELTADGLEELWDPILDANGHIVGVEAHRRVGQRNARVDIVPNLNIVLLPDEADPQALFAALHRSALHRLN